MVFGRNYFSSFWVRARNWQFFTRVVYIIFHNVYDKSNFFGRNMVTFKTCVIRRYFFENSFPVISQMFTWSKNGITHNIWQLPLSLAHAVTIYKSQGLTLTCGTIDIGTREFSAGSTYVALSRFQTMDQFMLRLLYAKKRWDITHLKQHLRKMNALNYLQSKY